MTALDDMKKIDERLRIVIGVHLILRKNDKILLARRYGTGYADGCYNFPCGHLDPDEEVKTGLIREAKEELGIIIKEADLTFIGCTHWRSNKQSVNLFFECQQWQGEPENGEPDKCDDVSWFALCGLPEKMVSQTAVVLGSYGRDLQPFFIEHVG